jgi:hypothetical protein
MRGGWKLNTDKACTRKYIYIYIYSISRGEQFILQNKIVQ